MAALTDDILMAYADGALDRETRRRVEALLHQDAACRRKVEIFRATGAPLADLFEMRGPVPAHLVNFVLESPGPTPRPAQAATSRLKDRLAAWGERLPFSFRDLSWQFAAAAAAALFLSAGGGWMARGSLDQPRSSELAAWDRGQIYALGAFQSVLEGAPSGHDVRITGTPQDSTVMRISLTFKDKAGQYCREYKLIAGRDSPSLGLACRTGVGNWTILTNLPAQAVVRSGAQTLPAGANSALDAVVDRMISGDALGKEKEEAAISSGWK